MRRIQLEDAFLDKFPDASIHTLIVEGLTKVNAETVSRWRQEAVTAVGSWKIDPQLLVAQPWIAEWRNAMKVMGVNAAKTRSSIEQLMKRALNGGSVKTPVPAVDLYCAVSTIARAPMGGYQTTRLNGDIHVRLARGTETFLGIGERVPMPVAPGVVIYADDEKVACYAWNHKDSAQTCLTPQTDRAIFFADGVSAAGRDRAAEGLTLLASALESCGCRIVFAGALDANLRALSVPLEAENTPDNKDVTTI